VRLLPHKVMQGLAGEDAVVERTVFNDIVTGLQERGYTVYGTVNEKGAGIFRPLGDAGELSLRCTGGTLPPKYLWYPPFETLFTYDRQTGGFHTDLEETRHAVFGIRPCDVHALLALDEVFLGGEYRDPYYRARRVDLPLVVFNCVEAGDTCFCSSMGTGPGLDHDYDLLITDLGRSNGEGSERFLLEVGSSRGGELARGLQGEAALPDDYQVKKRRLQETAAGERITLNTGDLPRLMHDGHDHPYWREVTDKCFGCANCTSVCPTCYCADIFDETDFSLRETRRKRRWSWCFLVEFGAVHGGNFREERIDRLRQFMQHKLNFSVGQYGFFHCVGCGRCIVWCPANIDIAQTGRVIRGDA
jgi:sulfhydrogenase subunit beta (sulfur reductase)